MTTYSEITFRDKNPIKRWLQRRRLRSAVKLVGHLHQAPAVICDFGAGNGELCKLLSSQYQSAKLICYEPMPDWLAEARASLNAVPHVEFFHDITSVQHETIDVVFCLEVFEHLPPAETQNALRTIHALLKPGGTVVVGVPVEVGIPALYKGLFRMSRRYGTFDACWMNVMHSFLGFPPQDRPIEEIAHGFNFHHEHMGFDYRRFQEVLRRYFGTHKVSASPISMFGPWLMPEAYFVAKKG